RPRSCGTPRSSRRNRSNGSARPGDSPASRSMLSDSQIDRYARQIVLPEIGGRGQERLLGARVAIRGSGDAALIAASYLAGAGVGSIAVDACETGTPIALALGFGTGEIAATITARNPDCRPGKDGESAEVVLSVGGPPPADLPADAVVVWGAA